MASSVDIYPHAIEQLQLENEVVTDDSKILDLFDQEGLNVTEVTDDYQLTIKYHDQYLVSSLHFFCRFTLMYINIIGLYLAATWMSKPRAQNASIAH